MPPRRPPSAVTMSTTSRWMSRVRPMTLGSTMIVEKMAQPSTRIVSLTVTEGDPGWPGSRDHPSG